MTKSTDKPAWTRNDALVAVGAAAADLLGFSVTSQFDGNPLGIPAAFALVLAGLTLILRHRHPAIVLTAVLALGVVVNTAGPVSPHFGLSLVIALYTVARSRRPAVVAVAGLAAVPLPSVGQGGMLLPGGWGVLANAVAAVIVVGAALAMNHRQRESEANRKLLAERALAEERRRIARELHDIVAHHITTMQLMAGGARANLAHDPGAAREALVILEGSGRMALSEMRQLLDVLRAGEEPETNPPAPQPGPEDLTRIVTESRLAGMDTELTVDGTVRPLPPTVGLTVFRVVQEALTNARKHAGDSRARVRLTYRPDEVTVEVRDDGTGRRPGEGRGQGAGDAPGSGSGRRTAASRAPARGGYGLIGMRERVALQGGTLEAAPLEEGGFRVAARLPVAPGAGVADGEEHHR
ncbi:sensor histidine kinase [Streptomyces sp. NPDC054904]|uniref:sensor histidine kinase n=1 Tax=Streptomyces sp. NPDC090054 TaxID=3365933 RepID=UPI00381F2004